MNSKTAAKVKKENKKPPQPKKDLQKEEDRPDEIKEIETKMFQGQEHVKEKSQENIEQPKEEVTKKQVIIKPRENYLQEKIAKMNPSKNLITNIQKELGDKIKNVIKEENVLITEVPKDLKKLIPKDSDRKPKNLDQIYFNKKKLKEVKKMNDELNVLKKSLTQLEQNKKLLEDEGYFKINKSQKGHTENVIDSAIKSQQIKDIEEKKEKLEDKIKGFEYQIKSIMEEQQTISNKEKFQEFLDNFERDKEIAETRAKKYLKEKSERNKRMKNDLDKIIEKRKKKMEEEDKKSKMEQEKFIKEFKEKEKALERMQSKRNEVKMLKYKPYINQILEQNKKDYLYNKKYENYLKKEEKFFKDESIKNKEKKDKLIYKFEDIDKFAEEFDEKVENRKYDQEQKSFELVQKWAKNKEQLPKSNFQTIAYEEENSKNVDEDEKKRVEENSEEKKSPFQKYGENVRENKMPEIDEKLKKQREAIINALEDPKKANKKYTLQNHRRNRIILKKRDNSKPSKFKWKLKLEENPLDKLDDVINNHLIRKPKKVNLIPITRTSSNLPDKKNDYLYEIIRKKEMERSNSSKIREDSNSGMIDIQKKSKKWEKALNNKSGNIYDNITDIKEKIDVIDQEASQKERLLIQVGGIGSNPELGKEYGGLLLDSIEAKINILKKMDKI